MTDTLDPLLVQIETELVRKLLAPYERDRYVFRFDRSGLATSDPEAAVSLCAKRIAAGIDTPNEARVSMGRPPVEGGDTVLMSANLKTISALVSEGSEETDTDNTGDTGDTDNTDNQSNDNTDNEQES